MKRKKATASTKVQTGNRYADLKQILEGRRREIVSEVQGRDPRRARRGQQNKVERRVRRRARAPKPISRKISSSPSSR